MENHLYECLYDIIRDTAPMSEKLPALQHYKAKIVRLHAERRKKALLDIHDHDILEGEEPTLFQVLRITRRREARGIQQVKDKQGITHSTTRGITDAFVAHLTHTYQPIAVEEEAIETILIYLHPASQATSAVQLEQPITEEELHTALRAGARRKAPGIDGMSLEFYTANWDTIREDRLRLLNHMFLEKKHLPETETRNAGLFAQIRQTNHNRGLPPNLPTNN